ncbi:chorismate-binding protein [Arthrobacter sp. Hiyo1]|uniref:chorismate-binding protein n=1 Tax=Arthrobacter sp. Hiyo1 TaxID=1588020 RepID=UPI001C0EA862|nr:chorismate-binding protein [Arthrobacter sp. Hiyo1]
MDPFTREPLTTWIGIRVDERRLNNDAEQFSELRRELDGLKVEGAPGGVFAFIAHPAGRDESDSSPGARSETPSAVFLRLVDYIYIDHVAGSARVIHVGSGDPAIPAKWAEMCESAKGQPLDLSPQEAQFEWAAAISEEEFANGVTSFQERASELGLGGVVLSVRMSSRHVSDAIMSYRVLRAINPSTCMFLLQRPGFALWGSTSLSLAEIHNRRIVAETDGATHPIPDMPNGDEYVWNPTAKEISEYDVVAEALWEDLAPISMPGTQRFTRELEQRIFFGLGHLFAEMRSVIADEHDEISVVEALAPHGAAVGHPRPAALALISELEVVPRGPFAGVVGMFGTDGVTDACSVTRSMWTTLGGSFVHAGAKVVPASVAREEYDESVLKTLALRQSARPLKM